MEKIIKTTIAMILITGNVFCQDIIRKGLLRSQLTISPSYNFSNDQSYFYFHGNSEFYLSKNVSVAGEGYYYLGTLSPNNNIFDFNHNLLWGPSYHFIKNNNDLYIGLQPGVSIAKLNAKENELQQTTWGINPLASLIIGYNYYVHQYVHFFMQSRLIIGEHTYNMHKGLNEFRFSAGLGFNL